MDDTIYFHKASSSFRTIEGKRFDARFVVTISVYPGPYRQATVPLTKLIPTDFTAEDLVLDFGEFKGTYPEYFLLDT